MRSKVFVVLLALVLVLGGCVPLPAVNPGGPLAAPPAPARTLGDSNFTNVKASYLGVAGPAVAGSATPAAYVDNAGTANDLLVLAKAGTPVWHVGNAGVVTGKVLQYGSSGKAVICGSQTITGTGVLATGLATPSYVLAGLAGDANYDHNRVSQTNASATVTVKVWNGAATPAASQAGVAVDWCVIGTP